VGASTARGVPDEERIRPRVMGGAASVAGTVGEVVQQ
jgi:hypothetical protein